MESCGVSVRVNSAVTGLRSRKFLTQAVRRRVPSGSTLKQKSASLRRTATSPAALLAGNPVLPPGKGKMMLTVRSHGREKSSSEKPRRPM